jgi:hypothetical protein
MGEGRVRVKQNLPFSLFAKEGEANGLQAILVKENNIVSLL